MLSDIVLNTVDINQQSPSPATSSFYPSIDPPVSNILSMITPSTDLIPLSCVFRQQSGISFWMDDIIYNYVVSNSSASIQVYLPCLISGGSATANAEFVLDQGYSFPSTWAIDLTNNKINFTTPYTSVDIINNYLIKVQTTEDLQHIFYIKIKIYINSCKISNWCNWKSDDDSRWVVWNSSYILSNNAWIYSPILQSQQDKSDIASASAIILVVAGWVWIGTSVINSILTFTSPQDLWSIVNQFQTLLLLLLTNAYFPDEITNTFIGIAQYLTFSFNFMPYADISFIKYIVSWFNQPVNGDLMSKVGLKSGSIIINNVSLIINIVFIITLHLVFLIIKWILSKKAQRSLKLKKLIDVIYRYFTFCLYIRLTMEIYQYLLIWSTSEIHYFNHNTDAQTISLAISFLVFSICIAAVFLVSVITIKNSKEINNKNFIELYNGVKDSKLSKWNSFAFILRKLLIVSWLCLLIDINIIVKVAYFEIVQALYFAYLAVARPFKKFKDNIIGIIHEALMLFLIGMLFKYNKDSNWTNLGKTIFFISISWVNILISFVCWSKY